MYIEIQYYIIHLLLLIIWGCIGLKIQHTSERYYWKYALIGISVFGLTEGLRWGREIDWILYFHVYEDFKRDIVTEHEFLFVALWRLFALFHLPYYVVVVFSSFLLSYSLFYFLKDYKNVFVLSLLYLVCIITHISENLQRWFLSASVLYISIRFLLDKKYYKAILSYVCASLIHIGTIMIIPFFYYLVHRKSYILKPKLAIIVLLVLTVTFEQTIISNLNSLFVMLLSINHRFLHYMDSSNEWLLNKNSEVEKSVIYNLLSIIPYCFTIYANYVILVTEDNNSANICCKKSSNLYYGITSINRYFIYNSFVVATWLMVICQGLELLGRYAYLFYPMVAVAMANGLVYYYRKKTLWSKIAFFCCLAFFIIKIHYFFKPIYDNPIFMGYVWDEDAIPLRTIENEYRYIINR